ncbi:MAG: hypothetical protein Q8T09_04390 [Candidatus Melainabacteria bacterium]|nr:hypothetical protein [Candidatus Melainabacteria bacterium]
MTKIEQPSLKLDSEDTFRILALENPENIDKLKEAWKSAGHQVVPVLTIAQAMAFLDSRDHVDLIISAVHLEDESVFEFLQRIKAPDSLHKDVSFVMLCMEPNPLASAINKSTELAGKLLGADKYVYMQEFDAELLIAQLEPLLPHTPKKETEANPDKP